MYRYNTIQYLSLTDQASHNISEQCKEMIKQIQWVNYSVVGDRIVQPLVEVD